VLSGAWRATPPAAELSEAERAVVAPLLLATGGAGLLWRQIPDPDWRASPTGFEVRQACRLSSLHAALHESRIERAIALCRSAGAEPFLGKGWAIARLYPTPGLRPYGDIDLYVSPDRCDLARAALARPEGGECAVDLHEGFAELDDRRPEELKARSQVVRLGAVDVRCFGPEDHLRLLCLHTLRHGAWRPLWLCDVGAALESRPPDFDWAYCLGGDRRRSDWVACALALAHQVLGADLAGVPRAVRERAVPSWLVRAMLEQWGTAGFEPHGTRVPMIETLWSPSRMVKALRARLPNAIEATVGVGGPFNSLPRLPYQLGECVRRTVRFALRAPGLLRPSRGSS
jgi:hypothetical protein